VERQQVVHAEGVEGDRADQDELVVALFIGKRGRPERPRGKQLLVGGRHAARGLAQAGDAQVGAERDEQVRGRALCGVRVDPAPNPLGFRRDDERHAAALGRWIHDPLSVGRRISLTCAAAYFGVVAEHVCRRRPR
jgi:hypothetical protein